MESASESAASRPHGNGVPAYPAVFSPRVTMASSPVPVPMRPGTARVESPGPASGTGQKAEVSAASSAAPGVTVTRVRVPSGTGYVVVVKDSRAVQAGVRSRQLNNFTYNIDKPRVSVDDVLRGDPGRMRAFANLVEHPNSMIANWAFRHRMSDKAEPQGRVRCISTSAPRTSRVAVQLDEQGQVMIVDSRGVQAGFRVTQRNTFNYRVVEPDLALEPMLRDNPELARTLALTARYPDNAAVKRSFTGRLARACEIPGRSSAEPSARFGRTIGIEVNQADAVQVGYGNVRKDDIDVRIRRVVLTGWTPPDGTTRSGGKRLSRPPGAQAPPARSPSPVSWSISGRHDRRPAQRRLTDPSPGRPGAGAASPAPADPPDRLGPPHRPGPAGPGGRF
jgi:hypothetical protein